MNSGTIMKRAAPAMVVLFLLTAVANLALAQAAEVHRLTVVTSPEQSGCAGDGITLATLDLRKWDSHTFFWVGTIMSPGNLSLAFCDSSGNALVSAGEDASISRSLLTLNDEIDGFIALEDLDGVTVRLNSADTLQPGDYVMRHWSFLHGAEERLFRFPDGYTQVTACGNETSDSNGVAVEVFSGKANEFTGNSLVDHLAVCERAGLGFVNPASAPGSLRESNGTVHVFHARGPVAAAAQSTADSETAGGQEDDGAAFTVTSFTPGIVRYPGEEEGADDDAAAGPGEMVVADEPFATLGALARLFHVTLPDGTAAVEVQLVSSDGSAMPNLTVDQNQVDAVDSGLIVATGDGRFVVSVSSLDIITFAMGPDDRGIVHYLEMDEGLAGPVSATSSRQGGPPGEAFS